MNGNIHNIRCSGWSSLSAGERTTIDLEMMAKLGKHNDVTSTKYFIAARQHYQGTTGHNLTSQSPFNSHNNVDDNTSK